MFKKGNFVWISSFEGMTMRIIPKKQK